MLQKNSRVLYILQCALNDEIFYYGCYYEATKDVWGKLTLLYEETRNNMLSNLSDEKEITHFCLMANEEVKDQDASDNDDDEKEDGEEMEYDAPEMRYMTVFIIILNVS